MSDAVIDRSTPAITAAAPVPTRRARAANTRPLAWLRRLVSPIVLILLWQALASAGVLSGRTLASPVRIAHTFVSLLADGTLETNLLVSLARVLVGLAFAIVLGVGLALTAGLSRLGEDAVDAPLQMVRTMPHLALVPLLIVWFGIGETPKIVLVALGGMFPIYLNLLSGIRGVDPRLLELARTLHLGRWGTIRHVVLPGAIAPALTGLRYAVGVGWLSLVVGEQINASSGIGFMMMDARDFMRTDVILVGLLVYAALGLLTDAGVRALERAALRWQIR